MTFRAHEIRRLQEESGSHYPLFLQAHHSTHLNTATGSGTVGLAERTFERARNASEHHGIGLARDKADEILGPGPHPRIQPVRCRQNSQRDEPPSSKHV
jgi:hypothetical protein